MAADQDLLASQPEHVQDFLVRYPVDERAQSYLLESSSAVVEGVLAEFKPKQEGESDYSGLLTSFVKRLRMKANAAGQHGGYVGGRMDQAAPRPHGPGSRPVQHYGKGGAANGHFGPSSAPKGGHRGPPIGSQPRSAPEPREPAEPIDPALEEALREFVERYPIDDSAYQFLSSSAPEVVGRVINDFKPKSEGDSDYSALLMTFVKRCRNDNRGSVAQEAHFEHSAGPSLADCDAFFARYPVDERCIDYFSQSTPEVQAKVLRDFKPKMEGESDYSGLLTSFCKKMKTSNVPAAQDAMRYQEQSQYSHGPSHYGGPVGGPAYGGKGSAGVSFARQPAHHQSRRPSGPGPADLDNFGRRYPMDERAWSYLTQSTPEVIEKVLTSFTPKRVDDRDHSAPITAYVKQCRRSVPDAAASTPGHHGASHYGGSWGPSGGHRHDSSQAWEQPRQQRTSWAHSQPGGGGGRGADASLRSFLDRYPVDERCADYLSMQPPDIVERVLSGFRPKKEGDSDYSAIVMSFTKRCKDQPGGGGGDGPPWKRART